MIKILLQSIREASANRPPGYFNDVVSRGTINGNAVELDEQVYADLLNKYRSGPNIVKNAIGSAARVASALLGGKKITVSPEEQERRMSICRGCEFFNGHRCLKCGCFVNLKTRLETEHCPINKW